MSALSANIARGLLPALTKAVQRAAYPWRALRATQNTHNGKKAQCRRGARRRTWRWHSAAGVARGRCGILGLEPGSSGPVSDAATPTSSTSAGVAGTKPARTMPTPTGDTSSVSLLHPAVPSVACCAHCPSRAYSAYPRVFQVILTSNTRIRQATDIKQLAQSILDGCSFLHFFLHFFLSVLHFYSCRHFIWTWRVQVSS